MLIGLLYGLVTWDVHFLIISVKLNDSAALLIIERGKR